MRLTLESSIGSACDQTYPSVDHQVKGSLSPKIQNLEKKEQASTIEERDVSGRTKLQCACASGDLNGAKYALTRYSQVDSRDRNYYEFMYRYLQNFLVLSDDFEAVEVRTPLMIAARVGRVDVVEFLLQSGAQVEGSDELLWDVLHEGIGSFHPMLPINEATEKGIMRQVVESGSEIRALNVGNAPLSIFDQEEDNTSVLSTLLTVKNNASPVAIRKARENLSELIRRRTGSPLQIAAQNGHAEVVRALLLGNADRFARDVSGRTALHLAAEEGHVSVVQQLAADRSALEERDSSGATPMISAAKNGHELVVGLLISTGANVEATDNLSRSALTWAVKHDHDTVVSLLLKCRVSISSTSVIGNTPLLVGLKMGVSPGMVRTLLQHGAYIHARDARGLGVGSMIQGSQYKREYARAIGDAIKARVLVLLVGNSCKTSPLSGLDRDAFSLIVESMIEKETSCLAIDSRASTPKKDMRTTIVSLLTFIYGERFF